MFITIRTSEFPMIDWAATGTAEIVQNVFTLMNTFKYEVAYDRTLGLKQDFIDMPEQEAVAFATAQIYSVIKEREPRVKVIDVSYQGLDDNAGLLFEVVIDI
ncbi:MAG: hypothetical protein K6T85_01810 [Gorillibacterium sp.]|nr:hypothetical protein [Gorillibacterium sp.]